MVLVCLTYDALLQHLPSYLGFSYLGRVVSLYGCSTKAQPLLLTLDEGYLLTIALPDLQRGMAPLGPQALLCPRSPCFLDVLSIIRLIIFFAAKHGEALCSQQKQDQELTVAQIMNSLLPNSD